jgi:hypothetical protein
MIVQPRHAFYNQTRAQPERKESRENLGPHVEANVQSCFFQAGTYLAPRNRPEKQRIPDCGLEALESDRGIHSGARLFDSMPHGNASVATSFLHLDVFSRPRLESRKATMEVKGNCGGLGR